MASDVIVQNLLANLTLYSQANVCREPAEAAAKAAVQLYQPRHGLTEEKLDTIANKLARRARDIPKDVRDEFLARVFPQLGKDRMQCADMRESARHDGALAPPGVGPRRAKGGSAASASALGWVDLPAELYCEIVHFLPLCAHAVVRQGNQALRARMDNDTFLRAPWDSAFASALTLLEAKEAGAKLYQPTALAVLNVMRANERRIRYDEPENAARLGTLWGALEWDFAPSQEPEHLHGDGDAAFVSTADIDLVTTLALHLSSSKIEAIYRSALDMLRSARTPAIGNAIGKLLAAVMLAAVAPRLDDAQVAHAIRTLFKAGQLFAVPAGFDNGTLATILGRGRVGEAACAELVACIELLLDNPHGEDVPRKLEILVRLCLRTRKTLGEPLSSRVLAAALSLVGEHVETAEDGNVGVTGRLLAAIGHELKDEHIADVLRVCDASPGLITHEGLRHLWHACNDAQRELAKGIAQRELDGFIAARLAVCDYRLADWQRAVTGFVALLGRDAVEAAFATATCAAEMPDSLFRMARAELLLTQTGLGKSTRVLERFLREWPPTHMLAPGPTVVQYVEACSACFDFAPCLTEPHVKQAVGYLVATAVSNVHDVTLSTSFAALSALTPRLAADDFRFIYRMVSPATGTPLTEQSFVVPDFVFVPETFASKWALQLLLFAYAPTSVGAEHFTSQQLAVMDALLGKYARSLHAALTTLGVVLPRGLVMYASERRFAMLTPRELARWSEEAVQRAQAAAPAAEQAP